MCFDLDFRPESYADFDDPVALALNGINGQMRREMVRDMMTAEGGHREAIEALGPIEPGILEERADESFIHSLSNVWGPSWMGGEYLPRLRRHEVEIARVVLNSTTMDVFSLRARWSGGRYHYRLVDEYQSTYVLCRKTSRRTLTLGQVIEILETVSGGIETDGAGLVACWWDQQWEYHDDPGACTAFAWVESDLYPELADWYQAQAREWEILHGAEGTAEPPDAEENEPGERPWALALPAPAPSVRLSLPQPQGWRWLPEEEFRRELDEWDVDLEARVGLSKDDVPLPNLRLVNTPPGYDSESCFVYAGILEDDDGQVWDTESSMLRALALIAELYDDVRVLWGPEPVVFRGLVGHKGAAHVSVRRHGKAPLHFDLRILHLGVGASLVEVTLGAPQGAPPEAWEELQAIYQSLRVEVNA